jgi:hypothetical protein
MAYILIHTSSQNKSLQNQALRLQSELLLIGHNVEFSMQTHPLRLFKNNYDVFHILSDQAHLSLLDTPLLLLAKFNRMGTVISHYDSYQTSPTQLLHQFQAGSIDALSTTNIESLKANKLIHKNKFVLPLFPTEIKLKNLEKTEDISQLKVLSKNFNELFHSNLPTFVDVSRFTLNQNASTIRKNWKKFQAQHLLYKKCVLILNNQNTFELMKSQSLILDLSSVTDSVNFQKFTDWACATDQFIVLNRNQASGYSDFWAHHKNCWISDLQPSTAWVTEEIQAAAKNFFKNTKSNSMKISIENKMNEISRLYAKIMHEKTLTYNQSKARASHE